MGGQAGRRLASEIKESAHRLGLPLVGVAPALPPPHHETLASWVAAGHAGEMAYLSRDPEKRSDPRRLLPGARSVVVVGAPYTPPLPTTGPSGSAGAAVHTGVVSAYARGEDYHRIMGERLVRLEREIARLLGEETRSWCDTGPVLERPLAAGAGLGWVGKNTLLISRQCGSWLFLGVLLTKGELPVDREAPDRCGTCRRCLDACPTGALRAPYVLDARRCVSYLTIELKGAIPRDLRSSLGHRLFGCDDCQLVCPWNQHPAEAVPLFRPRRELEALDLAAVLLMSEDSFRRELGHTPLARRGRRGLRRNAAVVAGNVGGPRLVEPLGRALADEDPLLREHAAWALGELACRLGGAAAECRVLLERALEREAEPTVRQEIEAGLGRC